MKKIGLIFCLILIFVGTVQAGGFIKEKTLPGGIVLANAYHRIVSVDINFIDKIIHVEMAFYKDSAVEGANIQDYIQGHPRTILIQNDPLDLIGGADYDNFLTTMGKDPLIPSLEAWIKANDDYFKTATSVGIP